MRDLPALLKRFYRWNTVLPDAVNALIHAVWVRLPGSAWVGRRRWLVRVVQDPLTPPILTLAAFPLFDRLGLASYPLLLLILLWVRVLALQHKLTGRRGRVLLAVVAVVFVGAPLVLRTQSPEYWERIGGASGYAFRLALIGLLIALFLKAAKTSVGAAGPPDRTARLRLVAVGVVCGVAYGLNAWVGSVPGWSVVNLPARLLGLEGLLTGLSVNAVGIASVGAALGTLLSLHRRTARAFVRSARAAFPAGAMIAVLVPIGLGYLPELRWLERSEVAHAGPFRGSLPPRPPGELAAESLAVAYSPVLLLHEEDRWPAIAVDSYLRDARIVRLDQGVPSGSGARLEDLPRGCSDPKRESDRPEAACYSIVGGCPGVDPACDEGQKGPWNFDGVVYARVVTADQPSNHSSADVLRPPLPFSDLRAVIQYWFFFAADLWEASTGIGTLRQRHEADWEAITIGLSPSKPLFVAYSAHCGGHWRHWAEVETELPAETDAGVRPRIWVAKGSHALYPDPLPREPNWTSCERIRHAPFALVSYAANVRETMPGPTHHRQAPVALMTRAGQQPFSFPGHWGERDELELAHLFRRQPLTVKRGPKSPPCQRLWHDPLALIFCDEHWVGPERRCPGRLRERLRALQEAAELCV